VANLPARAELPPEIVEVVRLAPGESIEGRESVKLGPGGHRIVATVLTVKDVVVYQGDRPDPQRYRALACLTFSPVGEVAYLGLVDGSWCLFRNGAIVGDRPYLTDPYSELGKLVWSPLGTSLASVTWRDRRRWHIVRDGLHVGVDYDECDQPAFSPDDQSFAFAARWGQKHFVVRGGRRVGGLYDWVAPPLFTPDGCSVMFVAAEGDRCFVVKDGVRVSRRYKGGAWLLLSPSGRSFALWVYQGWGTECPRPGVGRQYVVKNDRRMGGSYHGVRDMTFSAEGEVLAFAASLPCERSAAKRSEGNDEAEVIEPGRLSRGMVVVKDGEMVGQPYTRVGRPVLSRDGRSIAFRAYVDEGDVVREFVIKDGVAVHEEILRLPARLDSFSAATLLCLGPDGRSLAYDAAAAPYLRRVIWDGRQIGDEYHEVRYLTISPDGRTLMFMAKRGGKEFYVRNGKRVGHEYDWVTPPQTSLDRTKFIFAGVVGNAIYRNEVPW
jgi:hypothetical protein